jgi:MYXO-CTERM domain-containing protein
VCVARQGNGVACDESAAGNCKVPGCHLCTSDHCVDGYCCDGACGACGSCSQIKGTCTPKSHGALPDNPGCGEYLCDGAKGSCPSSCLNAANDCKPGDSCVGGKCGLTAPNGTACLVAAECDSGNCADGVCCNDACVGTCQACAAKLKQSQADDGLCGPALGGSNPRQMCKSDGKECGKTAACAGDSETCAYVAPATKCGVGLHCASGDVVDTQCDGKGACGDITKDTCAPYLCHAAACTKPCAGDGDCVDGYYCAGTTCVQKHKLGDECSTGTECGCGHCAPEHVCCSEACGGTCESCTEKKSYGTCVGITGDPRTNHGDCGTGDCKGTCNGTSTAKCAMPDSATTCGEAASCTGNVQSAQGTCDGNGQCKAGKTGPCPGSLRCDEVAGKCKTACTTTDDCISGASCNTATGECAGSAGTCADTFKKQLPNGSTESCLGYLCNAGACASTCAKPSECDVDNGYTCDAAHCVKPGGGGGATGTGTSTGNAPASGGGDTGSSGGCRAATGDAGGDGHAAVALALGALALAARRRRAAA